MRKTTFTLRIDVLEALDKRVDTETYVMGLYALTDAIKTSKDTDVDTFDTVMDILEYAQELIDGDGYYHKVRKMGDDFE
jgi:hypothetical protein